MQTVGKAARIGCAVAARNLESRIHLVRKAIAAVIGDPGDLAQAKLLRSIRRDDHRAIGINQLLLRTLEDMSGDREHLALHVLAGKGGCAADKNKTAAGPGSEPIAADCRIAKAHGDIIDADSELVSYDLRKRRLVTLTVTVGADEERDAAIRLDAHTCALERERHIAAPRCEIFGA